MCKDLLNKFYIRINFLAALLISALFEVKALGIRLMTSAAFIPPPMLMIACTNHIKARGSLCIGPTSITWVPMNSSVTKRAISVNILN